MTTLYALVGMKHRGTEALVGSLPEGTPLMLVREPTNAYDPNAIQVWCGDQHVGYVRKEQARALAAFMDQEPKIERANCILHCKDGGWPLVEVVE